MAHNRPVIVCLTVSIVFHLSMISVFSIVIRFPSRYVHYASLELVEAATPSSFRLTERIKSDRLVLQAPEPMDDPDSKLAMDNPFQDTKYKDTWATSLPIELPRLEFEEFERREQSLRIRSKLTEDPKLPELDSWAAFNSKLKGLGSLIAGMADVEDEASFSDAARVGAPAPGFGLYLEWITEPKNRTLLFAPPAQSLWALDPHALHGPLEFAFKVDALGKVEEIQILTNDDKGVATEIANSILRYRFEPLQNEQPVVQRGTLILKAESPDD